MNKLIIHLEFASDPSSLVNITEQELRHRLDVTLSQIREENEDFGWRFFPDLDSAAKWESGNKIAGLSEAAQEWLTVIKDCDGAEVPNESWGDINELVERGLVSFSSARGPGLFWRRAELVQVRCGTCGGYPDEHTGWYFTVTSEGYGTEEYGPYESQVDAHSAIARVQQAAVDLNDGMVREFSNPEEK